MLFLRTLRHCKCGQAFVFDSGEQQFMDVVFDAIGQGDHVITAPIIAANGNKIVEEFNFVYLSNNYEKRSPILLQGYARLIGLSG